MFRKVVVIALARHGVNLSGCPARTRTPRRGRGPRPTAVRRETSSIRICECDILRFSCRAPGHIDSSQALGAANGMGYGGVGKCVIPDDDNNPQGKFAGDRCQAVWTTDDSAACEVDQYGCPSVACDGSDKPWCMMEDGQNWCYCE